MVRIQGRGVAGTVAAKVRHFFGLCKDFEGKVWKWRRFLTDVGCGRYKMRHLQTKVGHLHTKGHGERYVGSLFRVDEPVPDDSAPKSQDFVDYRIHKTGKMLPHVKFSSKRSDFLRFYLYLCHVIDDFCLS